MSKQVPLTIQSLVVAVAVGVVCSAPPAAAQSSLQVPIQFDFLSPGARSLALGSAFVGLADDATAAWVNPAGLLELTKPEVSVEGRHRRLDQPFLVGGRLSGQPTGTLQDTLAGPDFANIRDSGTGATFSSFVYPKGRFRIAAYRHEPIRVRQDFSSRGVFQSRGFDVRDTAFSGQRTLDITTYGVSVAQAWRKLWLGGGLSINQFSLGFEFDRYLHESPYGAPDPRLSVFHFSQAGDGASVGVVVGVLIPVSTTTKVGASYRRMSSFEFSSLPGGLLGSQQRTTANFNVPDVLAAGLSTHVGDALLITAEYKRVFHSQLRADYVTVLVNQGESRDRADRFTIADANEVHAGAEYLLPLRTDPRLRAGLWFDPDHSVHFAPTPANDLLDERIAVSLSSGRDLWHSTFGASVTVHPRVELSVGVDHSARSLLVSTSAIVRF
jgi:long-chain fatty acid transport protein